MSLLVTFHRAASAEFIEARSSGEQRRGYVESDPINSVTLSILSIPRSWKGQLQQPPQGLPPTITMTLSTLL